MKILKNSLLSVKKTARCLKEEKVVIIPTDTVYGFSAIVDLKKDVSGQPARKKIFDLKGRAESKPLIQLISRPENIYKYTDQLIPEKLFKLWPGPLTLIVKISSQKTSSEFAQMFPTAGFRCPGDKWLRKVLTKLNCPVFSTSVNLSGEPNLETESQIDEVFGNKVDLFVSDGDKLNSKPSTIVSLLNDVPEVLREGACKVEF